MPRQFRIEHVGAFDQGLKRGGRRRSIIKDEKGRKNFVPPLREK